MKFKTRGAAKNLSLDTSTWPPKGKGREEGSEAGRPRTATLDKPLVLDIALLGHLDMTRLTRRGLLNACRWGGKGVIGVLAPATATALTATALTPRATPRLRASRASSRSDASGDEGPRTPGRRRGAAALVRQKKAVIEEDEESGCEDRFGTYRVRRNNRMNRTFRVPAIAKKRQPLENIINNNNNNNSVNMDGARRGSKQGSVVGVPNLDDILGMKEQVPEPCRTCGRPELPERLHSHPVKALPNSGASARPAPPHHDVVLVKNTVRKPVPIKYRPRRGSEMAAERPPARSPTRSPAAKGTMTSSSLSPSKMPSPRKRSPSTSTATTLFVEGPASPSRRQLGVPGPRLVTCFVCGREFGTASLPLHEPQCIQRWQLQNSKLPASWQRHLPDKPVGHITIDDWNKFAWEASKGADSVQCPNCLRRFGPDRINSHERVCFKKQPVLAGEPQSTHDSIGSAGSRGSSRASPLVECYLCGKRFGTRSIAIHEPQCLRKWQQVHGEAPAAPNNALLDKPRECPQAECKPSKPSKPLAIEPAPSPAGPAGPAAPAPNPGRPLRVAAVEVKSAWAGEDGVLQELSQVPAAPAAPAGPAAASTSPSRSTALCVAAAPTPAPVDSHPRKAPLTGNRRRGRPLRCYLCGQMFGLQSLSIHEPQCLQKWRLENAKLPPQLQRPEPEKPEIIFTEDGDVDYWRTFDRIWANHTESLIPCRTCGRRFFPDRIQIHEHACIASQARR